MALPATDDIEDKRRKLEDLLYDFEDYTEIDSFEEERFVQLQAATKSLALLVLDTIKRLKLDGVPVSPPPKATSFPPLPPLPPLPPSALLHGTVKSPSRPLPSSKPPSRPSSRGRDVATGPSPGPELPLRTPRAPNGMASGSTDGRRRRLTPQDLRRRDTLASHTSSQFSVDSLPPYSSEEAPPVPPPCPPWENTPLAQHTHPGQERRISTENLHGADYTQPASATRASSRQRHAQRRSSTPSTPEMLTSQSSLGRHANEAASPASTEPSVVDIPNFPSVPLNRTTAWVTDQAAVPASPRLLSRPLPIRESVIPEDQPVHNMTVFPNTPDGSGHASSLASAPPIPPPPLSLPSTADLHDPGVMVAEDWKTVISDGAHSGSRAHSSMLSREADCSIGPKSSLYQMKGFCEGAQAFKQGGPMQGIKKTTGYVAGATTHTGKCISCGYAHQYDELTLDVNRDPKANFTASSVRFRIRFLYKSHLTTDKLTEAYYGCLFCAQAGSVVREGDATVFANSDALFRHLARHPQPLPDVPGVTVLYGKDFREGDPRLNDFDVHFLEEPPDGSGGGMIPPAAAEADNIARLPVATATKMHVQRYGEKKLARPDGVGEKGMLQFFAGARIVGVEFPVKFGGKWATGWHDGDWGIFPAKHVELEKPRRSEMPPLLTHASANGGVVASVVARWKWEPRDAGDKGWLVFDKGETLTNVGWVFKEHWCWSGTNKKGQLGLFPRSHVLFDKVKEEIAPRIGSPVATMRPSTAAANKGRRGFFGLGKSSARSESSSISGGSSVLEIVL
ncbi:uncharacterized protein B0T15DRAFT_531098 [Chaetomium strumarium]|uniref:SH3 domain-containing protein n=1 Tax=Chaetomium strumarium TaxID=1170767 RepID=A0AAJ0GRW1_9PEZI|nr:hypothetical protein B0T15DRAFT_531098 [Chaetomium strumarium]